MQDIGLGSLFTNIFPFPHVLWYSFVVVSIAISYVFIFCNSYYVG